MLNTPPTFRTSTQLSLLTFTHLFYSCITVSHDYGDKLILVTYRIIYDQPNFSIKYVFTLIFLKKAGASAAKHTRFISAKRDA